MSFPGRGSGTAIGDDGLEQGLLSSHDNKEMSCETGISKTLPINIELSDLSLEFVHRSPLTFRTLSRVNILSKVNARMESGQLTAIMGVSGSGKTSLLDTLASRLTKAGTPVVDGKVYLNAQLQDDIAQLSNFTAYVTQQDELPAELTVEEALTFAARVKIPEAYASAERCTVIVNKLVSDLGLEDCVTNRIGGGWEGAERISGGERRRVSIALQLMGNPSVLLLDEPSSGLDSSSADRIIRFLSRLATTQNRTVICSIHQPSAKIFSLFNRLLLLSKGGRVAYEGPASAAIEHFSNIGFKRPRGLNIADFLLDVTAGVYPIQPGPYGGGRDYDMEDLKKLLIQQQHRQQIEHREEVMHQQRRRRTLRAFLEYQARKQQDNEATHRIRRSFGSKVPTPTPHFVQRRRDSVTLLRQIYVLTIREALMTWRNKSTAFGFIMQSVIIALCLGFIFYRTGDSPSDVGISKKSVLYLSSSNQPYITLVFAIYTACKDLKVFDQERADKLYAPAAYVFAHYFAHLPIHTIAPLLYYSTVYFMTGLRMDSWRYPCFYITIGIIAQNCAVAMAWLCAALLRRFETASLASNFLFTFTVLSGGFVVSWKTIPVWISWWRFVSFQGYAFSLFAINEYKDNVYKSTNMEQVDGNTVLQNIGIDSDWQKPLLGLFLCFGCMQAVAFLLLIFLPRQPQNEALAVPTAKAAMQRRPRPSYPMISGQEEKGGGASHSVKIPSSYSSSSSGSFAFPPPDSKGARGRSPLSPRSVSVTVENVTLNAKTNRRRRRWRRRRAEARQVLARAAPIGNSSSSSSSSVNAASGTLFHPNATRILDGVSADFPGGELTVVLGPSGSGKTSLLNVIAGRCSPAQFDISGRVLMNGCVMQGSSRGMVSFMRQDPSLLKGLTVVETIQFAASLSGKPSEDAEQIIRQLGLVDCADNLLSLCSGGERRRAAIGSYLVTKPAILLLDEPTTGLDAASSVRLVNTLKGLARTHATIIATIHQPRPELYNGFSTMVLVGKGRVCYSGAAAEAAEYFRRTFDSPAPPHVSVPEHLLSLLMPRDGSSPDDEEGFLLSPGEEKRDGFAGDSKQSGLLSFADAKNNRKHGDRRQQSNQTTMTKKKKEKRKSHRVPQIEEIWAAWAREEKLRKNRAENDVSQQQRQTAPVHEGNLSDFLPESLSLLQGGEEGIYDGHRAMMGDGYKNNNNNNKNNNKDKMAAESPEARRPKPVDMMPLLTAFVILFRRSSLNFFRQPIMILARFMQILSFGIIMSIFFWQTSKTQVGIVNIMNLLWETQALVFVGMLNCAALFPSQRDVFHRERADGRYSTLAFFLSYCALELPFGFLCSMIYALMITLTAGLEASITAIVVLGSGVFFVVGFGESVGMLYCACFRQVGFALSLISINLGVFQITTGFLTSKMPKIVDAILNLNPLRFSSELVVDVELKHMQFSCDDMAFAQCLETGEEVKEYYGFHSSLRSSLMVLIVICFGYRFMAYLALTFLPRVQGELHAEWHPESC